ncbi:MAG: DUF996 domain-containing protein [Methanobacteriota archaeon]
MTLDTSKNMGGIGALLVVIAPVGMGTIAGVLGLVGLILLLIALKGLADHYKEKAIFDNALYAFILTVVGVVAVVAVVVVTALATLSRLGFDMFNMTQWSQFGSMFANMANFNNLWTFISSIIIGLVVIFAFTIFAAFLFRKSMDSLAAKTKVSLFGTTGLIMLIGAALTIIAVGFLLIWVSFILLTVAFFSIKTK